jgi:hypothetical protein
VSPCRCSDARVGGNSRTAVSSRKTRFVSDAAGPRRRSRARLSDRAAEVIERSSAAGSICCSAPEEMSETADRECAIAPAGTLLVSLHVPSLLPRLRLLRLDVLLGFFL